MENENVVIFTVGPAGVIGLCPFVGRCVVTRVSVGGGSYISRLVGLTVVQ